MVAIVVANVVTPMFTSSNQFLGGTIGKTASRCDVATSTVKEIGPISAGTQTVLDAYSNRAWARISTQRNGTSTVFLSFDEGAAAVVNAGFGLNMAGTTSSTPQYVDFGLSTFFPYVGAVTAVMNNGSSTLLVTECRY